MPTTHTATVGHATVRINTQRVTSAWASANWHAEAAIAARKAGDRNAHWYHTTHERAYRDVALAYINGTVS